MTSYISSVYNSFSSRVESALFNTPKRKVAALATIQVASVVYATFFLDYPRIPDSMKRDVVLACSSSVLGNECATRIGACFGRIALNSFCAVILPVSCAKRIFAQCSKLLVSQEVDLEQGIKHKQE